VKINQLSLLGNISTNEILNKLKTLGFEVELSKETTQTKEEKKKLDTSKLKIKTLDVRFTLSSGLDPFKDIMKAIKSLKKDETLKIVNSFVPVPLIKILKFRRYKVWTEKINDDECHTYFTKGELPFIEEDFEVKENSEMSFDEKLKSFGNKIREIDVRHLEMPEPMVTILEEIETLDNDYVLLVKHKKVPQFLLPELKERNFKWMYKQNEEEGFVWFMVFK